MHIHLQPQHPGQQGGTVLPLRHNRDNPSGMRWGIRTSPGRRKTYETKKMKPGKISVFSAALTTILIFSGCMAGMVKTSQSVSSKLVAEEYNDIGSQYLDRPTFVSVEIMDDGSKVLCVTMKAYGPNAHEVRFFERDCGKYLVAIDKFLEWEAKAAQNKDIFEKVIAVIPEPNGFNLGFVFTSGNEEHHYLNVCWTMGSLMGKISAPALTFDRENAQILRKLFVDLPSMSAHPKADDYK